MAIKTIRVNTSFKIMTIFLDRNAPTWVQILKYTFFGFVSAFVMFGIILVLNLIFPSYVDCEIWDRETLALHTNIFNTLGFVPSCLVSYYTNKLFVFAPGKHNAWLEFFMFAAICAVSYVGGSMGSSWVVQSFHAPSLVGNIAFGFSSAVINYVCRKFFIFKN